MTHTTYNGHFRQEDTYLLIQALPGDLLCHHHQQQQQPSH